MDSTEDNFPSPPLEINLSCDNTGSSEEFNPDWCILCQKPDTKGKKKSSKPACRPTESGKNSLKRAAEARNDVVVKRRICALEGEGKTFLYHNTNECFKGYTLKKTIESLQREIFCEADGVENPEMRVEGEPNAMLRRSSTTPRDKPVGKPKSDFNANKLNCVIYGNTRVWVKNWAGFIKCKYRLSSEEGAGYLLAGIGYLLRRVLRRVMGC